jgi:AraC-like DNA-binding protein
MVAIDNKPSELVEEADVSLLEITQATTAVFADLYFRMPFLFFIKHGEKKVTLSNGDVFLGKAGDLMIFPAGASVTMENRPLYDKNYRADGVGFNTKLIDEVFSDQPLHGQKQDIYILRADEHQPFEILELIKDTLNHDKLPQIIRHHRLLEPLLWLKDKGVVLSAHSDSQPLSKIRRIIEQDLSHSWRANDIAQMLAMSEPTFRRWLSKSDLSFSKILNNSRLEYGLSLLQTTDMQISQIALECGFKTPSHFSDSFRKRFNIAPKMIRFTDI